MGLSTYSVLKNAKTKNRIEITGELLARMQQMLLGMLKDFSSVCEKHGFYYSLCGGTALGAVRHGGFIPWDDDIDVFMLRSEYEEFVACFDNELSDKYYLHSPEITPELGMPITQLMKKGTVLRTPTTPNAAQSGIYIDIFILENAPDNLFFRNIHGFGSLAIGFCLSCARFSKNKRELLDIYSDSGKEVITAVKKKAFIGKCLSVMPLKTWSKLFARWNSLCRNNNSKYVVCPTGVKHYFKEIFLREEYCNTKKIKFEDAEVRIIADAEKALERMYGNFWEIPPKEKREKLFAIEIEI